MKLLYISLLSTLFPSMAASNAKAADDYWIVLTTVGASAPNKTAYISRPIYYAGWKQRDNKSSQLFEGQMKQRFAEYLSARHREAFPHGVAPLDAHVLGQEYGSGMLTSRIEAEDRGQRRSGQRTVRRV